MADQNSSGDAPWPDEISVSIPPKNLRNVRVHKATCETCGGRKWVRLWPERLLSLPSELPGLTPQPSVVEGEK